MVAAGGGVGSVLDVVEPIFEPGGEGLVFRRQRSQRSQGRLGLGLIVCDFFERAGLHRVVQPGGKGVPFFARGETKLGFDFVGRVGIEQSLARIVEGAHIFGRGQLFWDGGGGRLGGEPSAGRDQRNEGGAAARER